MTKHSGVIPEKKDGKPQTRASRPLSCGLAHMRISLVESFMIDELGPYGTPRTGDGLVSKLTQKELSNVLCQCKETAHYWHFQCPQALSPE